MYLLSQPTWARQIVSLSNPLIKSSAVKITGETARAATKNMNVNVLVSDAESRSDNSDCNSSLSSNEGESEIVHDCQHELATPSAEMFLEDDLDMNFDLGSSDEIDQLVSEALFEIASD